MTTPDLNPTFEGSLHVEIAGDSEVEVRMFEVDEGISRLFAVHLEVVSRDPDIDLDAVTGRPARFTMLRDASGEAVRSWTGVCQSMQQVDVEDTEEGLSTYEMTIVPEMWF